MVMAATMQKSDAGGATLPGRMIRLVAPCKVNLLLRVLGRRADGYHELETWMQKLDLADEIVLKILPQPGIVLHCDDPALPGGPGNLAWRAAQSFFKASRKGQGKGVEIHLQKKIPAGAGLGGGSSDAGTVLRGLNTIFGREFTDQELVAMATPLGADVPFFAVDQVAVLATGIGEVMVPVPPLTDCSVILVNPGFSVSTRWVFETFALTSGREESRMAPSRIHDVNALSLDDMCNDLEQVTSGAFPEIEQMKQKLLDLGAYKAMMSGSGPTVFGVFPDGRSDMVAVQGAADRLRLEYKERVFVTRSCAGA
jgi:4-diphosphocytidyl-2-C-methyl-D-erythritol kinase